MSDSNGLRARLATVLPFLNQYPDLMEETLREGRQVTLEGGQFICMEGNMCSALPIVLDGLARVYKIGETGREITLYRLSTGDSCILTASCILNEKDFPAFAISEGAVVAFLIPSNVLRQWVSQHDPWRQYVFDLLANRLHTIIAVLEEVVFRRLDARLVTYLLDQATSQAGKRIRTTHEAIASDLGSSREVVSRLLKEFEHEGILHLERGNISIENFEKLAKRGNNL